MGKKTETAEIQTVAVPAEIVATTILPNLRNRLEKAEHKQALSKKNLDNFTAEVESLKSSIAEIEEKMPEDAQTSMPV